MASSPIPVQEAVAAVPHELPPLLVLAQTAGNIADALSVAELATLGNKVVDDYEKDDSDRKEWKDIAVEMLAAASQDKKGDDKDYPWSNPSNVNVPLLTIAALQFNARMYPAAIKGDEAILCKVIGQDNGVSMKGPDGHPMVLLNGQPVPAMVGFQAQQQQMAQQPPSQDPNAPPPAPPPPPVIAWAIPPGAKAKRARRVSEYLNTTIFYRMDDWEADTDALLTQLPIVGCSFRKVWFDAEKGAQSRMVPALRLVVPQHIRSLESSPRITEELPGIFPHEIKCKQREGYYLDVDLGIVDEDKERLLLEQQCWADLDDDDFDEPYIITVDKETRQVLRVEANFSPDDIKWSHDGRPTRITPGKFYVKYGFFPHPEGQFYDIGLGHLLKKVGATIDTCINQLIDAGNAQVAGGGFIASGLRLQGRASGSVIKFRPGEYRTVDMSGDDLRRAIVERTAPNVSPVTMQVLEFIMGFAKEIAGFKDILTGETASTAPVGTTLALIEQGLQVFNAIAKRFFRSSREEYQLLFDKVGRYGGQLLAQDYQTVLDDDEADFAKDFADKDMDIRPVSDPSAVTRMQKMAKAQYLGSIAEMIAQVGGDLREVVRRQLEAADVEDIDKLLPPPQPPPPNPVEQMKVVALQAVANKDNAHATKATAEAQAVQAMTAPKAAEHGAKADNANASAAEKAIKTLKDKHDLEMQAMLEGMGAAHL